MISLVNLTAHAPGVQNMHVAWCNIPIGQASVPLYRIVYHLVRCASLTYRAADNAPRSYKARSAWEEKLHEVIWSRDDDQPRFRHEKWRSVFDEQLQSNPISITTTANPLFALPLGEHVHEWQIWLSKEAVWDRFNTLSQIAILEGEEREVSGMSTSCHTESRFNLLLQRVYKIYSDAINAPDVETNDKGEIAIHGRTFSVWTTKIPQDGARAAISEVIDAVKDKLS